MTGSLRIFLCCQQAQQRHAVPAYSFWTDYFRGALTEAGHTIVEAPECDWAEGLLPADRPDHPAWRERTWEKALAFIRREHSRQPIDLFLSYLFPAQIEPGAIQQIRSLGIPCVNFFCDNVREFRRVPREFRAFDLHWVPEHKALPMYSQAGLRVINAPMACWVPPQFRVPVAHETLPVTFVGTRDATREDLFADAISSGLSVALRGPGWQSPLTSPVQPPTRAKNPLTLLQRQIGFIRQNGWMAYYRRHFGRSTPEPSQSFNFSHFAADAVFGEAYWDALRNAAVCLGVNRYPSWRFPTSQPDTYSRLRDIEAPMAGACYLTEWTEGISSLYELGVEIETYRDASELAEKTKQLLQDAPFRQRMRNAAQMRALQDHSIGRTIDRIVAQIIN